jgi:malate synthase
MILPFIGIVYALQCDVFIVIEQSIEFRTQTVKSELLKEELHIGPNERTVA